MPAKDCKSPFVKREVEMNNKVTKEEEPVWALIFIELEKDKGQMDLKGYDLVFFPLLENRHYYVIVFELKNPAIYILNYMHEDETVVSMKDDDNYFKKDTPYKVTENNLVHK
ncbi:hypothetical protein L1987_54240 [Smallanthus sonchifolius]|uniref:Uncharacterized protein n=1 Tax=Smallanthus sonchifolius TaxID=185202 RepID=A0ACB9E6P3_9ASTR|nr:hypothetical protein L1987_54240 [Smallanthus sonchifolius]